ncbi:ead/Ea22-like family protein [Enterobacter roggenkampii]
MSVKRYECGMTNAPTEYQSPTMHKDANGGYISYEDYSALEARCAALAAENAGLKAALHPSDIPSELTDAFGDTAVIEHDATGDNQGHSVSWSWVGNQEEVIKSVLLAVDGSIKTPETDAFLAEVRAKGVEMAMEHMQSSGSLTFGDCYISLNEFAAQLRKGVQS